MLRIGLGFGLNRGGVLPSSTPPFNPDDFIIKVKTDNAGTSGSNQFTLPTTGVGYDYTIDWGDGTIEDITSDASQTHTYPTTGEYVITISGTFPRILFNNGGDRLKLIETINFGDVGWTSMVGSFFGCANMDISSNATGVFGNISFSSTWRSCSSLTSFPALDLSGGTDFQNAWRGCSSMETFNATALGSGSYLATWNGCTSLTSFPALDLSGGTDFGTGSNNGTWRNCSSMTSFNATALGSGSYRQAWEGCSSLTSFPALDLSGGTDFDSAWMNCSSMVSFGVTNFGNVTSLLRSWQGCSSLEYFPLIDSSNITDFRGSWRNCSSLTSFPLIDTSNGVIFGGNTIGAWDGCSGLTSFPALDLSSGTEFRDAWRNIGVLNSFASRNFYGMIDGQDAFRNTTLPTSDYSDILVTQRLNNNNNDVTFHGGNSKYNVDGGIARAELTDDVASGGQNWSITDNGPE